MQEKSRVKLIRQKFGKAVPLIGSSWWLINYLFFFKKVLTFFVQLENSNELGHHPDDQALLLRFTSQSTCYAFTFSSVLFPMLLNRLYSCLEDRNINQEEKSMLFNSGAPTSVMALALLGAEIAHGVNPFAPLFLKNKDAYFFHQSFSLNFNRCWVWTVAMSGFYRVVGTWLTSLELVFAEKLSSLKHKREKLKRSFFDEIDKYIYLGVPVSMVMSLIYYFQPFPVSSRFFTVLFLSQLQTSSYEKFFYESPPSRAMSFDWNVLSDYLPPSSFNNISLFNVTALVGTNPYPGTRINELWRVPLSFYQMPSSFLAMSYNQTHFVGFELDVHQPETVYFTDANIFSAVGHEAVLYSVFQGSLVIGLFFVLLDKYCEMAKHARQSLINRSLSIKNFFLSLDENKRISISIKSSLLMGLSLSVVWPILRLPQSITDDLIHPSVVYFNNSYDGRLINFSQSNVEDNPLSLLQVVERIGLGSIAILSQTVLRFGPYALSDQLPDKYMDSFSWMMLIGLFIWNTSQSIFPFLTIFLSGIVISKEIFRNNSTNHNPLPNSNSVQSGFREGF